MPNVTEAYFTTPCAIRWVFPVSQSALSHTTHERLIRQKKLPWSLEKEEESSLNGFSFLMRCFTNTFVSIAEDEDSTQLGNAFDSTKPSRAPTQWQLPTKSNPLQREQFSQKVTILREEIVTLYPDQCC